MKHIVIIGNGISGITAARHIRKLSDHRITVISGESDHFYSRTALMYIYMGHMRYKDTKPYEDHFWARNRIELLRAWVERIDHEKKELVTDAGAISYDDLIIATGSSSNRFGWPGQDLKGVQGLYSLQDLEQMEDHTASISRAVVVGGGLIGIEMAEMLHSRGIEVTMLVRESSYWNKVLPPEESAMITKHVCEEHGIDIQFDTELESIGGTERVDHVITSTGERIDCQFVGLTVGVSPNVDAFKGGALEIDRGVLVNEFLETNLANVYAVGDCAQRREPLPGRRAIEQVWYAGRMMGETVARTITGNRTAYAPGIWFNSAKFFDLEWQVYGDVPASRSEAELTLVWQHGSKLIRINYEGGSGKVTGFNLISTRYRHEVCDAWLKEGTHIETVLTNLGAANFDGEFEPENEQHLIDQYNERTGTHVKLKRRRGLFANMLSTIIE